MGRRGRHHLMAGHQSGGEYREAQEQHHRHGRLQSVDCLITEHPYDALRPQHEHHSQRKRQVQQGRKRLGPEQADQPVPGDRRQPLDDRDHGHCRPECHARVGELRGPGSWPPGGQVGHRQRAEKRSDDHRQQSQPETQTQHHGERAGEHHRHGHLGGEPQREQPAGAAVAVGGRHRRNAVRLHRQVARARRHPAGVGLPGEDGAGRTGLLCHACSLGGLLAPVGARHRRRLCVMVRLLLLAPVGARHRRRLCVVVRLLLLAPVGARHRRRTKLARCDHPHVRAVPPYAA